MDNIKGKLITTLKSAMQPDIDKWVASDDNHVATFDLKPIGALWSFHDLGVTPTDHDTISVIQEGAYFRIKYNAATKYIITKHGDVFLIGYNLGDPNIQINSRIVTNSAISKALYTTFFHPDSTDTIFMNEIFKTIGDWVKTHMTDANWQTNGIEFAITKAGFRSTIDIRSAVNNAKARCVRINGSILAIWSGNEWISNDPLKGNVCARGLSIHEVGCLRDVIVNIKPEQKPSDSKLFEEYLENLSPEDAKYLPEALLKIDLHKVASFDTFKNIMDDLISHGNTTTQKPDSTDEQLLKSSNAKSFDELFEQLESIKHVVVPPSMIGIDPLTDDFDTYKQITDDLKSLVNATGQPIITAVQKPDRNRQMLNRIKPIICKWLKDIVYSAGPFSTITVIKPPQLLYAEEDPCVIPDSLAKSLCRSDKVITPIRFTPSTHNFKSWYPTRRMIAEAVNLKTMPEGAGLIMEIVKERNNMIKIPGIKNVLFNDTKQTTTVLFDDGTITMSKTMDGETYDREVGFAMCIMKKMYGNRTRFQKEIKRWTSICENANKKIADKAAKKQDKDKDDTVS